MQAWQKETLNWTTEKMNIMWNQVTPATAGDPAVVNFCSRWVFSLYYFYTQIVRLNFGDSFSHCWLLTTSSNGFKCVQLTGVIDVLNLAKYENKVWHKMTRDQCFPILLFNMTTNNLHCSPSLKPIKKVNFTFFQSIRVYSIPFTSKTYAIYVQILYTS